MRPGTDAAPPLLACAAALSVALAMPAGTANAGAAPGVRLASASTAAPAHVMLIVLENRPETVLEGGDAPYLASLASAHGIATDAYGQSHPSLPNYLELLSGSTQGVHDDGTSYSFGGPTLVDELRSAGIGWRAYMEGMPAACDLRSTSGRYAIKHDPFAYFTTITGDPSACANVEPYAQLGSDLAGDTAPPFLWVTPDLCDDGHDCSTAHVDAWLHSQLPLVFASQWFADSGVVIITWDEGTDDAGCCGDASGGRIATVVIARDLPGHQATSTPVDHAGTLRTIEMLYGVPFLGDSACACSGTLLALTGGPQVVSWLSVARWR